MRVGFGLSPVSGGMQLGFEKRQKNRWARERINLYTFDDIPSALLFSHYLRESFGNVAISQQMSTVIKGLVQTGRPVCELCNQSLTHLGNQTFSPKKRN